MVIAIVQMTRSRDSSPPPGDATVQEIQTVKGTAPPFPSSDYGDTFLYRGDCLSAMRNMLEDGFAGMFAAVVCDPPYGLDFSGMSWDSPDTIAFRPEVWTLAMELLAPGGHLVAFGSSRTYHRLACAVEDAGFEIRDQLLWLYGQGRAVDQDVSKEIDRVLGFEREKKVIPFSKSTIGNTKNRKDHRPNHTLARERGYHVTAGDTPLSEEAIHWNGWGNNLKPGHEPIVLARKPLERAPGVKRGNPTLAKNALAYGCGPINTGACPGPDGRQAGNVLCEAAPDVVDAFPMVSAKTSAASYFSAFGWSPDEEDAKNWHYCAKYKVSEYEHCTIKPVSVMRWLIRLLCPPGGVVLDPFSGSGTTLEAALLEGRYSVGCEMNEASWADTRLRITRAQEKLAAA